MAVESEAEHIKKLIRDILLLPITFILFLLRKRKFSELITPIRDLWVFFWDAKATAILISINVFVYIFILVLVSTNFLGIGDFRAFFQAYFEDGPSNLIALNFFPIFMSIFTHFEFYHILSNMTFLFVFGRIVEKNLGSKKTIISYVVLGVMAGIFRDVVQINELGLFAIGASGAVMGLGMLALLLEPFAFTFILYGIPTPIFFWVWIYMFLDFFSAIAATKDGVSYLAHVGGYLSATAFGFLAFREYRDKMKRNLLISFVSIVAIYIIWSLKLIPLLLSYLGLGIA